EVDRLYRGEPRQPIARALRRPVELFQLPRGEFLAVIDGMEMDARGPIQAPSDEELTLYCRRVAGAVGLLSIRAFGARGAEAERLALALGEALQLTNILRDLGEDAAIGRIYLPRELLAKQGIVGRDPVSLLADPLLPPVLEEVAERAKARFAEAHALLAKLPRKRLRGARIMMEVYRRQLELLCARGWRDPSAPPPHLARFEKLWIVLRNLFG
ncbi:MAG: squalene/phytoene synthase family protein, partial [Kiloniellales bacterium]